jgi:glucosyl-dolichyl phosphate glucuronosyltransferase
MSIVMSTFNRASVLAAAIERLVAQRTALPYELIVINNNSTDGTRGVMDAAAARYPHLVRCGFEGRQGVSHGRNKGIELSQAPVVAFTDDDVLVTPDWLDQLASGLAAHPEVDCVGGRVLPVWKTPPPRWVTRRHWSPLALVDYGAAPFYVDPERPVCLVTANVAYRRTALDAIGWFAPEFTRCQDHELLLRLWRSGRRGLYLPSAVVICEVPASRLTWAYHRRWHADRGRFLARMPDAGVHAGASGAPRPTLFGAPAACYRELMGSAFRWLVARATGRGVAARDAEAVVRQRASFIATRWREWKQSGGRVPREVLRFLLAWARRRGRKRLEPAAADVAGAA